MPMPGPVSKGFILKHLSEVCSNQKPPLTGTVSVRDAFLADLRDEGQNLVAIFAKYGVAQVDEEQRHLREEWFDEETGWWPHAQPVEPIIRQGLIKAIEVATHNPDTGAERKSPLPVEGYWICHPGPHPAPHPGHEDEHVEVAVCWSDQQVTFIIHSPEPPERVPLHLLTGKDPILIVRRVGAEVKSTDMEDLYSESGGKKREKTKIVAERMKTFDQRYSQILSKWRKARPSQS